MWQVQQGVGFWQPLHAACLQAQDKYSASLAGTIIRSGAVSLSDWRWLPGARCAQKKGKSKAGIAGSLSRTTAALICGARCALGAGSPNPRRISTKMCTYSTVSPATAVLCAPPLFVLCLAETSRPCGTQPSCMHITTAFQIGVLGCNGMYPLAIQWTLLEVPAWLGGRANEHGHLL
jgi:hypothetical protein